ncbi:MAG: hypothetical protein B0D92_06360 [Spirochaeta sp. LUC14_002_19_P3]|nr:MAG: hypothetical protein B0D92_06360 [Spirochaeta sp. LUC14_002_19_P3]
MKIFRGRASGKLILFGEHVAVYGYPAAGISLPCSTEAILNSESVPSAESGMPQGRTVSMSACQNKKDKEILLRLLQCAEEEGIPAGQWSVLSDVPRTGGFGSSAALCAALARVLLRCESGYSPQVHRLANAMERIFHGSPSGLDTGLALFGASSAWFPRHGGIPAPLPLPLPGLHLVYGALPREADTGSLVGEIKQRFESGDGKTMECLRGLGALSGEFIRLASRWRGKGERAFFQGMVSAVLGAQSLLGALGLSSRPLDVLLALSRERGSVGGKLSGAGRGGAFFLLAADERGGNELLENLPERLVREGIKLAVPLKVINTGKGSSKKPV